MTAHGDEQLLRLIRQGSKPLRPLPTGVIDSGRLPRAPRAVLFDVYGTLLARVENAASAVRRRAIESVARKHRLALTAEGLETALRERIAHEHSVLRARGVRQPEVRIEKIWESVFPGHSRREIRALIVAYELAAHPAWPMPGSRRVISFLARRGVTLGILSNAQFYTPLFLRALLGVDLGVLGFAPQLCLYSFDLGVAKPDASVFDHARALLLSRGVTPAETIMVGNSPEEDIAPAARCGFMTVRAGLDRRSFAAEAPVRSKPDAVIGTLVSLCRLFPEHVQPPSL